MNLIPNGYFVDDYMLFGDLGRGSVLAKGYAAQFPDLSASDDQGFMDLESDLRLMLGCLNADERLQLQFYTSSDFAGPLARFKDATWRNGQIDICTSVREELVRRFQGRMEEGTLIHTQVRLYLSSQLPRFVTDSGRRVRGFRGCLQGFKTFRSSSGNSSSICCLPLTAAAYAGSITWVTMVRCCVFGPRARPASSETERG